MKHPAISIPVSFVLAAAILGQDSQIASHAQVKSKASDIDSQVPVSEELDKAREAVLSGRPYNINAGKSTDTYVLKVLPSSVNSSNLLPEWWSEKQGYDLAKLYALALAKYPAFKVIPPQTWNEKILAEDPASAMKQSIHEELVQNSAVGRRATRSSTTRILTGKQLETAFNVDAYSFQYLPIKKRGIGLGIFAITAKECSTETYLKSDIFIRPDSPATVAPAYGLTTETAQKPSLEDRLFISRVITETTGGASLNLNFLVGGAGGGNFKPPAKPLKQMLYESVVDAAEAAYCMATYNQECLEYYKTRQQVAPQKLTEKQKRKVGAC